MSKSVEIKVNQPKVAKINGIEVPLWITFVEASKCKGVSKQAIYNWANEKKIETKLEEKTGIMLVSSLDIENLDPKRKQRKDVILSKIEELDAKICLLEVKVATLTKKNV